MKKRVIRIRIIAAPTPGICVWVTTKNWTCCVKQAERTTTFGERLAAALGIDTAMAAAVAERMATAAATAETRQSIVTMKETVRKCSTSR